MNNFMKATVIAGGITLLSYASAIAGNLNHQKILSKINQYLSHFSTVDKARSIADTIRGQEVIDQDLLHKIALAFAKSGNPANAVWYASNLSDPAKQYEVVETVIKRGNPSTGRWLLQKMPDEYKLKGIELLIESGNPANARLLSGYMKK